MKIALLGKGKTGGKVLEQLIASKISHTIFDSTNIPTIDKLQSHDVIISFLPGEAFKIYMPMLIESKIPVICGSTGMTWPLDINNELISKNIKWIYATNFSLGMNLVHQMINIMSKASKIFNKYSFSLNEIHHTKKLDAPSGTALSWASWTNHDIEITSERIGDVIGIHELTLQTANEKISIKHEALDRKIFAEGALFAANIITGDISLAPGLHLFQDIVERELDKSN